MYHTVRKIKEGICLKMEFTWFIVFSGLSTASSTLFLYGKIKILRSDIPANIYLFKDNNENTLETVKDDCVFLNNVTYVF